MLALVTGGQGFIGSHLCACLLAAGHQVRVLARPGSNPANLAGLGVTFVQGDLAGDGDLGPAVAGVDWVFHLAGALKGFTPADLLRVNRDGTRKLVAACTARAVPPARFILVSSLAAAGPSAGGPQPRLEQDPCQPLTWYGASKLAAEAELTGSPLASVILRPPVVFGPRERDVYSYFQMARRGLLPVPGRSDRHYSLIYGPDLAAGILRAAEVPTASGEVFHLTGPEVVTWRDLGQRIARALGREGRVLPLPESLLRVAGHAADGLARVSGRAQIFSSQKVIEMLAPAWVASPDKARKLLGWAAPTPLDEALALTVRWYRDHGWL